MSLLDFLSGDNAQLGLNLLAAGGPTTDPNATGIGSRLAGAVNATRASRDANDDRAMRRTLLQSQIDENASQNAARRAQLERQTRMDNYYLGGGGAGGQSASMPEGSALKAAIGAPANAPRPPQGKFAEWSQQFGIPVDALVADYMSNGGKGIADMLMKRGTPDMQVANGYAYDKNKLGAGYLPSLTVTPSGQVTQISIDQRGQPIASAPQGSADLFRQNQRTTQEEAKRLEGQEVYDTDPNSPTYGAKVLRSKLDIYGGAPAGGPVIGGVGPVGNGRGPVNGQNIPNPMAPRPEDTDQGLIYGQELRAAQGRLDAATSAGDADAAERARQDVAGILREVRSNRIQLPTPAIGGGRGAMNPAPAMPAPAIGPAANVVELSPAQQTANEAARTRAVEQAKADVQPTASRVQKYTAASDAIGLIDKTIAHPGLSRATGLGVWNPVNKVPGTEGADFNVLRDQLRGTAFLSAYNELKGGGAITEVEGRKAEDAIARLNTAQSEKAFREALGDYRAVLERGMKRAAGTLPAGAVDDLPDRSAPQAKRSVADLLKQYGGK